MSCTIVQLLGQKEEEEAFAFDFGGGGLTLQSSQSAVRCFQKSRVPTASEQTTSTTKITFILFGVRWIDQQQR